MHGHISDEEDDEFHRQLPGLAHRAFSEARARALAAGCSIMETGGEGEAYGLYEIFPDGTRTFVKKIAHPTKVKKGLKIRF